MDEIIKQKCEALGLSPDVLTQEEKSRLIEEIKAEKKGKTIIGGVLDNQELYFRNVKRD